jgi:6-phosphofructokinase 1
MSKCIGILTAGGDSPGLNAAIRAVGKSLLHYNIQLLGFRDGFEGLVYDKTMFLNNDDLSGILTAGGTVLGTSRTKPQKMPVGKNIMDMTDVIVENYRKHQLDALICIGGGGTHKSALKLKEKGLNIITLPKTIDNDIACTDNSIGFDTALRIATDAIDSLHSTASSHKRIMLVEIMGHRAGWLTLGAGLAGGADVILIPELPYDLNNVANAILQRSREGKRFSIVPVAEGAVSKAEALQFAQAAARKEKAASKKDKDKSKIELENLWLAHTGNTLRIAQKLEELTGQETRVTILGYLQRGGKPSPFDRILATKLGNACVDLVRKRQFGYMVAAKGQNIEPVPIEEVAGKLKLVPQGHPWIKSARETGISFGA